MPTDSPDPFSEAFLARLHDLVFGVTPQEEAELLADALPTPASASRLAVTPPTPHPRPGRG